MEKKKKERVFQGDSARSPLGLQSCFKFVIVVIRRLTTHNSGATERRVWMERAGPARSGGAPPTNMLRDDSTTSDQAKNRVLHVTHHFLELLCFMLPQCRVTGSRYVVRIEFGKQFKSSPFVLCRY